MESKEDLRIVKTRKAIKQTFLEMRAEMPLEKIHIRELCKRALINKSTSYNKSVVFIDRSPAECYNSFRVLWIGINLLPQRRFVEGSNHSFFV